MTFHKSLRYTGCSRLFFFFEQKLRLSFLFHPVLQGASFGILVVMKRLFLTSSVHKVAKDIATKLSEASGRNLVFILTASENDTEDLSWRDTDRKALVDAGFLVTDYTFTGKTRDQIEKDLRSFDVLHLEGGNTYYLLKVIQETGCADVLCELVEEGVPFIGCSAGSIVVGPDIYPIRHTDPIKEFLKLESYEGLKLVDFIVLPHWGSEHFKALYLGNRIKFNYNEEHKLFFLTDNQYIYVKDDWMQFIDIKRQSTN